METKKSGTYCTRLFETIEARVSLDPGDGSIELGDTVEETLLKEIAEEYCTDMFSF